MVVINHRHLQEPHITDELSRRGRLEGGTEKRTDHPVAFQSKFRDRYLLQYNYTYACFSLCEQAERNNSVSSVHLAFRSLQDNLAKINKGTHTRPLGLMAWLEMRQCFCYQTKLFNSDCKSHSWFSFLYTIYIIQGNE